jgi:hypothetical protein
MRIFAVENDSNDATIELDQVAVYWAKYYYDAQADSMQPKNASTETISFTWSITEWSWVSVDLPLRRQANWDCEITLKFKFTYKEWKSTYKRQYGKLYVDMNWWPQAKHRMTTADGTKSEWDSNYYYTYLPLRDRKLVDVWSYSYSSSYWIKGVTFQALYKWTSYWIEQELWNFKIIYDFVQDMGWESDPSMDIIWMIVWNEQIYMIGNLDWNGYIIPCDLTWGRWTPYIAYGCEFKWVTNIDYLLYLVWKDRWISQLWVYNGHELVPILWGNRLSGNVDIIGVDEQYNFDWRIVEYRGNLVLTTTDNRVFEYGQTYGWKWWAFILELPTDWTITGLKTKWNNLILDYSATELWVTNNLSITYQDDVAIKTYNDEWEAVYPIVLWNHLLEKEESDLYASYILPSSECSLEFWGMANHYHFWTFKSNQNETLDPAVDYKLKWATGTYKLKFIEKNGWWYTFRLEWNLPAQTGGWKIITNSTWGEILPYTEFHHFRKIWTITASGYTEWEFRFHNLNNKLELPKSHSLQIMVKWEWTTSATAELFALDLVANQRERW